MKATLPECPFSISLIMLPSNISGISLVRISQNLSLNSSDARVQVLLNWLSTQMSMLNVYIQIPISLKHPATTMKSHSLVLIR